MSGPSPVELIGLDGSVSDGGTALSAAVNFENYDAARRLVELGAKTVL